MIRKSMIVAVLALVVGSFVSAEEESRYESIDVPGATSTSAQGINPGGDVVGSYMNATGTHGFLLNDGAFTTIDYPNAVYTDARGINAQGEIVGSYRLAGEPSVNFHGYLRSKDGHFTDVNFPGHINTIPQRITSSGLIVGCRHDTDTMSTMRGVMINAREPAETAEIDAFGSMNNGALPDGGLIVGLYTDMDTMQGRGYLLYDETFIPFDVPGSTFTAAWDVNPSGNIVGVYRDATGFHGFLWASTGFYAVNYPGATATRAFGINARGNIVGTYIDVANRNHGFITRLKGDRPE